MVLALCILAACRVGKSTLPNTHTPPVPLPTTTHPPLVLEDLIQPAGSTAPLDDRAIFEKSVLTFRQAIEQVVSRDQVINILTTGCDAGLTFDESRDIRWRAGRLELEASAQIDLQANHCKHARLDLETGEILECADTACVVY